MSLRTHDWGDPLPNGDRPCTRDGCSTVWVEAFEDPPPWGCSGGRDHEWSEDGDGWWTCEGCDGREWSPDGEPGVGYGCRKLKTSSESARKFKNQRSSLSPVSDSNSGREHQKDEQFREYVRSLPCLVCGASPPSDPAHVKNWGAGHGDTDNLVPLCRKHHDEEENAIGGGPETFQAEHGIDLKEEAKRIGREYRDRAQLREARDG